MGDIETTDVGAGLRPLNLREYVGQQRMRDTLDVMCKRAVADDAPLPHLLFTGPPGIGKTTLARALAASVGDELTVVRKPMPTDRFLKLLMARGAGIVFLDELHLWPKQTQSDLLPLCDEERVFEGRYGTYQFPHLTLIGATTDEHKLLGPLVSRFVVPPFDDYTDDEMADIVAAMGVKLGMDLTDEMCETLAGAAGGVPRMAKHLVEQARSLLVARDRPPTAAEVLDFAQIGVDGITRRHLEYLRALLLLGGQAGIAGIASMMQAPVDIAVQCERLLLRHRMIMRTPSGRLLTPEGEHRAADADAPIHRMLPRSARQQVLV